MKKIAFFDTKDYDKIWFNKFNDKYKITYFEEKLNSNTARLSKGFDAVCAFVNDDINSDVINTLYENNVKLIVMRSAGYSNVDFKEAYNKINILRVPAYSPHAVAEHAITLALTINRKIHKAYNRTREFNFSLNGLLGMDFYGKTVGVIGTGKIGRAFIDICNGFGMKVIAYDAYQSDEKIKYVSLDELFRESDLISLHLPLTKDTYHLLNDDAFSKMKKGVIIVNTSRGALIDSEALLKALNEEKIRGVGLDVYEEEASYFFEDMSSKIIKDDILSLLVTKPNVIITSHQGFFTEEALENIALITLKNLDDYFEDRILENEVCYQCGKIKENCNKSTNKKRCF